MQLKPGDNREKEKIRRLLPYFWFTAGAIEILIAFSYLLKHPAGIIWVGYIVIGGGYIIVGVALYVDVNGLSKKFVALSGVLFGIFLQMVAVCRVNFITHTYDVTSCMTFILGGCTVVLCATFNRKLS